MVRCAFRFPFAGLAAAGCRCFRPLVSMICRGFEYTLSLGQVTYKNSKEEQRLRKGARAWDSPE